MQKRQALTWYIALQAGLLLCFYFPFLDGSKEFFFRDVTHYEEPFCNFIAQAINHMRMPLWNPFTYCGMSQAAVSVHSYFYLPTFIFAALPFSKAVAATMIFHQTLCGAGAFLLISSLGWGLIPATMGGATLAMSGYMFSLVPNFTLVSTAAWCPLVFWSLRSLTLQVEAGAPRKDLVLRTAMAALCVGMLILTGQPEIATVALGAAGLMVLVPAVKAKSLSVLAWPVRALGLGVLLAMPVILPAYEWLQLSRRAGGLMPAETLLLSANWYDLLNLILPQPLGDLQLRYSPFRQLVMVGAMVPYVTAPFVGAIAVTFFLIGIADKTFKDRWILLAALVLAVLLALGANGPLSPPLLQLFPSISFIRFPIKLTFFLIFGLSLFAARGLGNAIDGSASIKAAASFWLLFLVLCLPPLLGASYVARTDTLALAAQSLIAGSSLFWGTTGLMLTFLVALRVKGKIKASWLVALSLGLSCAAQLYFAYAYCHRGAEAGFFSQPSYVATKLHELSSKDANAGQRHIGLYLERFSIPHKYAGRQALPATINMYQYSRQLLRPNTNMDAALGSSFGFEGTCTNDYHYFLMNAYLKSSQVFDGRQGPPADEALARFCQLTATRYVLTQCYRYDNNGAPIATALMDQRFFDSVDTNEELNVRIYRLKQTLPRAYFASSIKLSPAHDKTIEEMFAPEKSGFDPLHTTILDDAPESLRLAAQPPRDNTIGKQKILSLVDEFNQVELDVQTPGQAVLVLADQKYPGWLADIDGQAVPIMTANGFMRALLVPPGKHHIRFTYQPASVYGGIALAALAIIWIFYLAAPIIIRKRARV